MSELRDMRVAELRIRKIILTCDNPWGQAPWVIPKWNMASHKTFALRAHFRYTFRQKSCFTERMIAMTITQLRYFSIAAQMENLSAAANALYITQSSLSKNIASLEKELGVQLFDRKGKTLHLNEAGDYFRESCQKILAEFDDSVERLRQFDLKNDTRIRIGVEGEPGPLISWMSDFREMHPETVFDIDSSLAKSEHPDISEYDVMIYPEGRKYRKYKGFPLYREEYYLAVPDGDPLVGREPISNRHLNGRDMVFLREGNGGYEHPLEICRTLMIETGSIHIVDSETLKRKMIAEGIACGFVSAENAELYRNDRKIWLLPLVSRRFTRQINICFKRKKHLSALAEEFCSYAASCADITDLNE